MKEIYMDDRRVCFDYDDVNFTKFHFFDGNRTKKYREGTYNFSQIRSVEIIKNNQSVQTGGHSLVGGLLFGTPGAIIGSNIGRKTEEVVREVILRIHLDNADKSFVDITVYRKDGHFLFGRVLEESEQACMTIYNMLQDYLGRKQTMQKEPTVPMRQRSAVSKPQSPDPFTDEVWNLLKLHDKKLIADDVFGRSVAEELHRIKGDYSL